MVTKFEMPTIEANPNRLMFMFGVRYLFSLVDT